MKRSEFNPNKVEKSMVTLGEMALEGAKTFGSVPDEELVRLAHECVDLIPTGAVTLDTLIHAALTLHIRRHSQGGPRLPVPPYL